MKMDFDQADSLIWKTRARNILGPCVPLCIPILYMLARLLLATSLRLDFLLLLFVGLWPRPRFLL
jgi:hypothetical protein